VSEVERDQRQDEARWRLPLHDTPGPFKGRGRGRVGGIDWTQCPGRRVSLFLLFLLLLLLLLLLSLLRLLLHVLVILSKHTNLRFQSA
jgi:hypothetical protein